MAQVTLTANTVSSPAWAADGLGYMSLLPAPGHLDAASFTPGADGRVYLPSGTVLGRTFAERDAGTGYGAAALGDEDVRLLAFDVFDALKNNECTLYRPGSVVKENKLPEVIAATLTPDALALVRANYSCITGVA